MYNFNYYTPTKVVFGKNTEDQCGELVKEQGCKKVLIHYGNGSVRRSGLLDKVKASLDDAEVDYIELGGAVIQDFLWCMKESSLQRKKV